MQNESPEPPDEDRALEAANRDAVRDAYFAAQASPPLRPQFEGVSPANAPPRGVPLRREVRYRRRIILPIVLFFATCATTFYAGSRIQPWPMETLQALTELRGKVTSQELDAVFLRHNWRNAGMYMLSVMGILLCHEMGHFLQAVRYKIHASLPFFIPMPAPPIGTMGAVISMHGYQADRKQLFDIGLSGPLAGLLLAIPIAILGIKTAMVVPIDNEHWIDDPLLFKGLMWLLRPDIGPNETLLMNSWLMAAWVGLFITGLNMMPVGQLDGGHVTYALFGRRAHTIARIFMVGALVYIIMAKNYNWLLMYGLVVFLLGIRHPPTANDAAPLGAGRKIIGFASLSLPILCFVPNPFNW